VPLPHERTPFIDSLPRAALELSPIAPLHREAVVLESQGAYASIAARRVGVGRVTQIGYLDDWRWRMAGGEHAPEQYRAWLAGLVGGVAIVGRSPLPPRGDDAAPLATLIERLGAPVTAVAVVGTDGRRLSTWLFALILAGLVVEWASRRSRGEA
jgi:hypothetical protein